MNMRGQAIKKQHNNDCVVKMNIIIATQAAPPRHNMIPKG
jgi:hypothetical protein